MEELKKSPLLESDLRDAACICLCAASMTNIQLFDLRHSYHKRRHRFEQAIKLMKLGVNSLLELGITPEDCAWIAKKIKPIQQNEGIISRFQAAENQLKQIH